MADKKKKRSPSKADRDPLIIEIKALRDSIPDKEAAGEACKGLYACYKDPKGNRDCLAAIRAKLEALKGMAASSLAPKKKKVAEAAGGKSRTRGRSRRRARSRSRSRGKK